MNQERTIIKRDSTVCASASRRFDIFDVNKQSKIRKIQPNLFVENTQTDEDCIHTPARPQCVAEHLETRKEFACQPTLNNTQSYNNRSTPKHTLPLKMTISRAAKRKLDFAAAPRSEFPGQVEEDSLEEIFNQNPMRLSNLIQLDDLLKVISSVMQENQISTFPTIISTWDSDDELENFPSYDDLLSKYSLNSADERSIQNSSWTKLSDGELDGFLVTDANQLRNDFPNSSGESRCSSYSPLLASSPPEKQLLLDASDLCANYQSLSQNSLVDVCQKEIESQPIESEDLSTFNEKLQSMSAEEVMQVVRRLQQQP
ncbi:Hypothetical predicted protein [Cloeon dipterum]|uniref:Uncharacterized protein n=1 Tax=Cloeon dipterum TaxID=197152 RepID=A0A8S1E2Y8_9INSE|nr:Hypothetical predicted protein [Cloeon dipterum]